MAAAAELAVSRHRELIEGSHRLLIAACATDAVRKAAEPTATQADLAECGAYLAGLVKKFPAEYSAAIVTDANGVGRCASAPAAVGTSFKDRDVFNLVRDTMGFAIGALHREPRHVANHHTDGRPDRRRRAFSRDVLARHLAQGVLRARPVGGNQRGDVVSSWSTAAGRRSAAAPRWRRRCRLPSGSPPPSSPARLVFTDYGQDGSLREFHMQPLASDAIVCRDGSAPLTETFATLVADGACCALIVMALGRRAAGGLDRHRPLVPASARAISRSSPTASPAARTSSWPAAALDARDSIGDREGVRAMAEAHRQPGERSCAPASSSATTCFARSIIA